MGPAYFTRIPDATVFVIFIISCVVTIPTIVSAWV